MKKLIWREVTAPDGTVLKVQVNLAESSISWLHARAMISPRQYDAAEALRLDWERAQMGPRVTMNWESAAAPSGGRRGGAATPIGSERQTAARDRLHGALDTAGPGLKDILWRVACAGEGLSAAERALGWPGRAGKLVLGFALDRVADYYRIR